MCMRACKRARVCTVCVCGGRGGGQLLNMRHTGTVCIDVKIAFSCNALSLAIDLANNRTDNVASQSVSSFDRFGSRLHVNVSLHYTHLPFASYVPVHSVSKQTEAKSANQLFAFPGIKVHKHARTCAKSQTVLLQTLSIGSYSRICTAGANFPTNCL